MKKEIRFFSTILAMFLLVGCGKNKTSSNEVSSSENEGSTKTSEATSNASSSSLLSSGSSLSSIVSSQPSSSVSTTSVDSIVKVTSVDITSIQDNLAIIIGDKVALEATVLPENATDKTVIWTSADTSVASVTDGVLTALSEGSVKITAKAGDKEDSAYVICRQPLSNEKHDRYIEKQSDKQSVITTEAVVDNIVDYGVEGKVTVFAMDYSYSYRLINVDKDAVSVGKKYKFVGNGAGLSYPAIDMSKGTITFISDSDSYFHSLQSTLEFKNSRDLYVGEEGIMNPVTDTEKTGEQITEIHFEYKEKKYILNYDSNNTKATEIAEKFNSVKDGSYVYSVNGIWVGDDETDTTRTIEIISPEGIDLFVKPTSITINITEEQKKIEEGRTFQCTATVYPLTADQKVEWSVNDPSRVSIDENGLLNTLSVGTFTLNARINIHGIRLHSYVFMEVIEASTSSFIENINE